MMHQIIAIHAGITVIIHHLTKQINYNIVVPSINIHHVNFLLNIHATFEIKQKNPVEQ